MPSTYEPLVDHDEADTGANDQNWPHVHDDEESKISTSTTLNSYPPGPSTGNGTGSSTVTFVFVPRWPLRGKQESVLGVMGKDKTETAEIVRRSFPSLASYPPSRIDFYAPVAENSSIIREPWGEVKLSGGAGWSRIIPEAWERLEHDSPGRLVIMVADAPGEAAERARRDRKHMIIFIVVLSSPLWGILGAICIAALTGNMS